MDRGRARKVNRTSTTSAKGGARILSHDYISISEAIALFDSL